MLLFYFVIVLTSPIGACISKREYIILHNALLKGKNQNFLSINKKSPRQLAPHHNNITSDKYHLTKWKCTAGPKLIHFVEWCRIHSWVAKPSKTKEQECRSTAWLSGRTRAGKEHKDKAKKQSLQKNTPKPITPPLFYAMKQQTLSNSCFFIWTLTTFLKKRLLLPSTQS